MERQRMEGHISHLEELFENAIEPIGQDGRRAMLEELFRQMGVEEPIPRYCPDGREWTTAEQYTEDFREVLKFARESLIHLEVGEHAAGEFRIVDVRFDKA